MTGLFGIATAVPQAVLMGITIPITAIYQVLLQWKIKNLEYLDVTDEDLEMGEHTPIETPTEEKGSPILDARSSNTSHSGGAGAGAGVTGTGAGVAPTGSTPGIEGSAGNQAIDAAAGQLAVKNAKGPRRGQASMNDYHHPAVTAPVPVIWIPEDPLGISKEEIRDTKAVGDIKITDGGATLDEKNKMAWSEDPPDYEP
jgi:hypothetical protein